MKRKNATRRALFTSVLSLLLCVSMLVGTTFAWFTDEVKSGTNTIAAGNLDVELEYAKVVDGQITGWDKVNENTKNIFDPNALWEPGRVEVAYLKVSNLGTLALKYQLGVNVVNETPGISVKTNEEFNLSDHLVFKVVDMPGAVTIYSDREAVQAAAGTEKGLKDYDGATKSLDPVGGENDEDYVALIVYMPETVGNEANYRGEKPFIELGVNLFATQKMQEDDSFGDDYDENAWHDAMKVFTAAELQTALNNGGKVMVMDAINLTEAVEVPAGVEVSVNLNGKTVSNDVGYVFENKGDLTIDGNGTLAGLGIIRSTAGKVTIENGNFYASSQWQNNVYQHTLKAENTNVVINGGNFDATVNGQTNAVMNASTGATITINGGNFKNVSGELTQFDPYLFTYEKDGKVVINDGTFYGGWRFNGETATTNIYGGNFTVGFDGQSFNASSTHKLTVYGGTFTNGAKMTAKLNDVMAEGYHVIVVDNNSVVVPSNTVDSVAELESMLGNNVSATLFNCQEPDAIINVPTSYTGTLTLKNSVIKSVQAEKDANIVIEGTVVVNANGSGISTVAETGEEAFNGSAITANGILNISGTGNLTAIAADVKHAAGIGGDNTTAITIENVHIVDAKGSYAQSAVTSSWGKKDSNGGAAIGSGHSGAVITLNNVTIDKAQGGSKAAGIGGRYWTGVTINITDSTIKNVVGGSSSAGIGGSRVSSGATVAENITINIVNSTINAIGGDYGAGIGSGYSTYLIPESEGRPVYTINVDENSVINATGGVAAAGIGTGHNVVGLAGEIKSENVTAKAGQATCPAPNVDCCYNRVRTDAQNIGFGSLADEIIDDPITKTITYLGKQVDFPVILVASGENLNKFLSGGGNVVLAEDIEMEAATTAPYGNKYGVALNGGVLDGNGNELYMECYGDDYGVMTTGGTIKNLTIQEGCRAVMIMYPTQDIILDNVNIGGDGVLYPINTGEAGEEGVNLIVTNSTLAGWTSYGNIESASFTNVKFEQGTYYNNIYGRVLKPYVNTTLTDCSFIEHMNLDLSALAQGQKITITNCTVNGQAVTADVFTVPSTDAEYDTELFTVDLPSWATSVTDCIVFN